MKNYETSVIKTKYPKEDPYGSLSMPVYNTAAYEFPDAKSMADAFCGRSPEHAYSRISNPTVQFFEKKVQTYTGAFSVTALNTGMAAVCYALTTIVGSGNNIVTSKHLFGNSLSFMVNTLANLGIETRFADLTNVEETEKVVDENTCAIFLEVITNPQMEVCDLEALSAMAHKHNVPLIADSTIVPFSAFHAKDFGVDIEVVSSTKYISGGATCLGGLVLDYAKFDWSKGASQALKKRAKRTGKAAFTSRIKTELITNLGAMMTPQVAYMQSLGMDTLDIRYRRQSESALWIAMQLKICDGVTVNYTGLPDNPYYELSKKQFGDLPGAMLTIDLQSQDACYKFINNLKLIKRATNLFDNKSLAIHPASTIFGTFTEEEKVAMDVNPRTVRLSIGLENKEDILDDIKQAVANI